MLATYHYFADGTKYKVMDPDNNGSVYIGPFSYTTAKAGNTVYSYLEWIDTNCQNNTIPLHRENPLKHFSFIINKKNGWLKLINFGDMTNIEIAKQVLGEDCEEHCTLVEEPPYKGFAVVACNPNSEDGKVLLGLPSFVIIKDGVGKMAKGKVYDDLLFRDIDD